MGFGWTPGWTLLLVIPCTFMVIFALWAISRYFRSSKQSKIDEPEVVQAPYFKVDHSLLNSLYSDPTRDITNPRDSIPCALLSDTKYYTPPPTRPQSLYAPSIYTSRTKSYASSLWRSSDGDHESLADDRSDNAVVSVVQTRSSSPEFRTHARSRSLYNVPCARSRASSISSTNRPSDSRSPSRPRSINYQSRSRAGSQSSHRPTLSRKSTELSPEDIRTTSASLAEIRNSLYSEDSPMYVRPEEPGTTPSMSRSRNSSSTNLTTMTSRNNSSSSLASASRANRYSCPNLTRLSSYSSASIQRDASPSRSSKRQPRMSLDPDAPPVPPLTDPSRWLVKPNLARPKMETQHNEEFGKLAWKSDPYESCSSSEIRMSRPRSQGAPATQALPIQPRQGYFDGYTPFDGTRREFIREENWWNYG